MESKWIRTGALDNFCRSKRNQTDTSLYTIKMMIRLFTVLLLPTLTAAWSMGPPKTVTVTKDDLKSSTYPITSDDWVPWCHGEVDLSQAQFTHSRMSLDKYVEKEYERWLVKYNKKRSTKSFQIWRNNYLSLLEDMEDGLGGVQSFELNEFGDLTPEEHRREVLLLDAYTDWCQEYSKPQSAKNYSIFKLNLLQQVVNSESVDQEIVLNEHADQVANLDFYMETIKQEPHLETFRTTRTNPPEIVGTEASETGGYFQHKNQIYEYDETNHHRPMPNYVQSTQQHWKDSTNGFSSNLHP